MGSNNPESGNNQASTPQGGRQPNQQGSAGGGQSDKRRRRELRESAPLLPEEDVLIDARPAWSAFAGQLLLAGVIIIFGLVLSGNAVTGNAPLGFAVIVALGIVGYVFYQRRKVRYLVTDRRVIVLTGISSRSTNEAWMEDVRGMQTGASFLERLLGHGHISISTDIIPRNSTLPGLGLIFSIVPAMQGAQMTLGGIKNYEDIAQRIRMRQSERKRSRR